MSLPRYPEYKKSNLDYLGTVPGHWPIKRVKFLLADTNDSMKIGPFGSQLTSDMLVAEGAKVYGQENVISKNFSRGARFITEEKRAELNVYAVLAGDILVTMMGTSGRCAIVPIGAADGVMDSHLLRIRLSAEVIPKFFQRLIDEADYVAHQVATLGKGSIMHGLNSGIVKQLELAIPPVVEQNAIATFLDRETGKIDTLIAEQEKLLALLAEKRQATISHAVTKGLNPDVPMKDSSVAWLGNVPAHWRIGKIQNFAKRESGHTPSRQHPEWWENCTIPWFSLADVWQLRTGNVKYVYETKELVSELGLANSSARLLPAGTVMLSRTASVGYSAIMGCDMATTQDFINWVCKPELSPDFLLYVLRGMKSEFDRLMMGSTHQTIYMPDVAKLMMGLPPVTEQAAIVSFLDTETTRLDTLTAEAERAISLLTERRAALIAAAVTGKIDVRKAIQC